MSKRSLILIDLSGIFWAAWHATADQDVSAAFDATVGKVHQLRDGHDLVAICCDAPPYHRKELLPTYKAQRDTPPAQALEQFARVKARLEADGLLLWSVKGFEADDVIAAAVEHAKLDGISVVVASSDKDLLQLVSENVRVHSPGSGSVYDIEGTIAKWGVTPDMIADLLALTGDKSDNVPGIPGVGPKTAAKLLHEFGSLLDVLANADKVDQPKLRESLIEHGKAALLARKVIALRTDVPIDWKELFIERKPKPLREVSAPGPDDGFDEDEDERGSAPRAAAKPEPARPEAHKPAEAPPLKAPLAKAPTGAELVVHQEQDWAMMLEPRNLKQAWWMAEQLHNSRLYSSYGSPEAVYAVIMRGRSIGLDATTSLACFHVIEGKPSMSADLIVALVLRSGMAEYFDLKESTRERATYVAKRKGSKHELEITWTVDDAVDARLMRKEGNEYRGVGKEGKPSNWDKYRRAMLRHRAATELARAIFPDIVMGLYTPDELSDGTAKVIDAEFEAA